MTEEIATDHSEVGVDLQGLQSVEELASLLSVEELASLLHLMSPGERKKEREKGRIGPPIDLVREKVFCR